VADKILPDFIPFEDVESTGSGSALPDFIPFEDVQPVVRHSAIEDDTPQQQAEPGFLESMYNGVIKLPGQTYDAITSIPSGIGNIYDAIVHPIDSAQNGTTEKVARGAGGIGSALAGAGVGGTFGGPIGAIIGGGAGLMGFDVLNELTGSDAPTTPQQKINKFGENLGAGLATAGAAKALQSTTEAIAPGLRSTARGIDRKSLGARQSDYGTANNMKTVTLPDGEIGSVVRKNLDELVDSGAIPKTRSAAKLSKWSQENIKSLAKEQYRIIDEFEKNGGTVQPNFSRANKMILDGEIPADKMEAYTNRLANLEETIKNKGQGRAHFLQNQKEAIGKLWDDADKTANEFNRKLYLDLKDSLDQAIPDLAPINKNLGRFQVVDPILKRSLAAAEGFDSVSWLDKLKHTTGGSMAPAIAGAAVGGSVGGPVGFALGTGMGLLNTPAGKAAIARGLKSAAAAMSATGNTIGAVGPQGLATASQIVQGVQARNNPTASRRSPKDGSDRGSLSLSSSSRRPIYADEPASSRPEDRFVNRASDVSKNSTTQAIGRQESLVAGGSPQNKAQSKTQTQRRDGSISSSNVTPKAETSASVNPVNFYPKASDPKIAKALTKLPPLIQAVISVESAGDHTATSRVGARGLMQLMPENLKTFGVTDPEDPIQNVKAGMTLLNEEVDRFGDMRLALAAYNAGSPAVKAAMKKARSERFEDIYPFLPNETTVYVAKVMKKLDQFGEA